jgi:hypothetical protein
MVAMDATELSAYSVQHNPWHASMYNAATAQTMAVGGFVQATMDTVEFDPSGMVSGLGGTTAKFTIQQDGVYLICGAVTMNSVADGVRFCTAIYRNGAEMVRGLDDTSGGASSLLTSSCWATQYCKAGDTIDIRGQNFTTNEAVHAGASLIYLAIAYVGAA